MSTTDGYFDPSLAQIVQLVNKFFKFPLACIKESDVQDVKIDLLSKGKGFQSNVYCVAILLHSGETAQFAVKVPRLCAFDVVNESATKSGHILEAADRTAIDGFNNECDFYMNACFLRSELPLPDTYYIERLVENRPGSGLICMESLCSVGDLVGIGSSLNAEQAFNVVSFIARLQFHTHKGRLTNLQNKNQRLPVHLQEFYLNHLPGAMPQIQNIQEIADLLPSIKPVFSRKFAFYALLEKPKEYGCTGFCHGDLYSNNIMFKLRADGTARELYILAICQQTVFLVAFVGLLLVTDRKPNGDPPDCSETIKKRAIAAMKVCKRLIDENNLSEPNFE
ncbi:hypothetical protein M3Y97_00111800 [Aphelenchoides bicaudatus]|nr:hypothetical protein M3Y97_00111800 [Aphelenchoides bicaudatus]